METFTLELSFWLVEYMSTFILIPQSHSQQGQNTSILSFFLRKGGIKCVDYLEIISTSKNLTSATENETTKN